MSNKFSFFFILFVLIAMTGLPIYLYPIMPSEMASHWNTVGAVDGYLSKFWGLFLFPIITLAFVLLLSVLSKINPFKENFFAFRKEYNLIIVWIIFFLLYFYALILVWNLGFRFSIGRFAVPAVGALFLIFGYVLPKTRLNWFLGIRTPWTLSSEKVWIQTHKAGGILFMSMGLVSLISGFLFPEQSILLIIGLVVVAVAWSFWYSYRLYCRNGANNTSL